MSDYSQEEQQEVTDMEEQDAPGCCQEFSGSIVGLGLGLLLVIASIPLLWWNEQRYITTWRLLDEASKIVVEAPCNALKEDNFGRLVHVTCPLEVHGVPPVDFLGVDAPQGTAVLARRAEMLQWREDVDETEERDGDHRKIVKHYSYSKVWSEDPIDSSSFRYPDECVKGHQRIPCRNPPWPEELRGPSKFWASIIDAGVFRLPIDLRDAIPADKDFSPPLEEYYGSDGRVYRRTSGGGLSTTLPGQAEALGDLRLRYNVNSAEEVSVIGAQAYSTRANATFSSFKTPKGSTFRPVLEVGEKSSADMFETLIQSNEMAAWLLRLAGWVVCWVGLGLCAQPLQLMVSRVPCVGEFLGEAVFCVLCCSAGFVSFASSIAVVSVAWLFYRPFISVPLLAVSAGIIGYVVWGRGKRNKHDQDGWEPVPAQPPISPGSPQYTFPWAASPPPGIGGSRWPQPGYPTAQPIDPRPPYPPPQGYYGAGQAQQQPYGIGEPGHFYPQSSQGSQQQQTFLPGHSVPRFNAAAAFDWQKGGGVPKV